MKKPSIKNVAASMINLALVGLVKLDTPRMAYVERKYIQNLKDNSTKEEFLDEMAQLFALACIRERIENGEYNECDDDQPLVDFKQELAFAKIAVRNV